MSNRVKGIVRRIADSPRVGPVLQRLTVPYAPTAAGINLVVAEHYGMTIGRSFSDDDEAARHYFREGWRLGVVPNPFVDAPGTRFTLAAAVVLRNALAGLALNAHAPFPFRVSRYAPEDNEAGVVELTRRARRAPESVMVRVGPATMSWLAYLQRCAELAPAAQRIIAHRLMDIPFYASQVGGAQPITLHAALDDYIANGELDGRLPNPFFEAEWYHVFERSLVRRGRPVNLFLDFVEGGEKAQASPHFWGHRYAQRIGGEAAPASLLAHFLEHAPATSSTPSSEGVDPVARETAERIVRARTAEYHRQESMKWATDPVLARHRRAGRTGAETVDGTCLVFVDERHLTTPASVDALRAVFRQRITGLRVVIIEQDDIPRLPETEALIDETAALDGVARADVDETFGAVVRRFVETTRPDGWTLWTPAQKWEDDLLSSALRALAEHPGAPAAAAVSETAAQPWLRTDDALWVTAGDGAGVVFAGSGERAVLPDASLDLGVAWRELIALAASETACVAIEEPLIRMIASEEVGALDARAGANTARSRFLAPFDRTPSDGVAVAIPTFEDWRMTLTAVRHVLATTGDDTVVHIVDNGSRRPVTSVLDTAFAGVDRVVVRRMARNTDFALGSDVAASDAARRLTVFLNNDTAVQPGWLEPLVEALEDPGTAAVQPLLLYGDRTVQTAGTIFLGGMSMPRHLLADVHPLDVEASLDDYAFSALTGACLAVRYDDLREAGGFDPHYVNGMEDVDLCMQLRAKGGLHVRTASRVVHYESRTPGRHNHHFDNRRRFARRWRQELVGDLDDRDVLAGNAVQIEDVRWRVPAGSPLWEPAIIYARTPAAVVDEKAPRLRWAIKTSATGDISGDSWGDTYFAESLAGALRRLGQEAVIDRRTAHDRPSSTSWDDVTLTLRGLERYLPQPGAINLLWVISHPDLVTRYELESGFQRIYAAGRPWAERTSEHWGVDVRTLLQATDTTKFHPAAGEGAERDGVLFVGRTRGVARPIVLDTIAAGATPEVYGDDGWEQFIDPRFVKGAGIHNDDVPAAYGSAAFVLNDHWSDMAENGFFSNRLFDAAATGTRIVSDVVPGMEDVFGPQVQMYRTVADLRRLLDPESDAWPTADELAALAERAVAEHSFDARARTLLDDALAARKERR
ncbi:glycosyltransferase [Microbacterium betulae]|uniref:Glycosyltransferase n=1 Tax=Microbacterium betulae TaxID=2981139 RepID=A0AA97I803_9MICO|nr:glycosyltransferase [Microbacterium sp. AB]WOF24182.1 glycosyltransferase [Microbacterium sp. AB]